MRRNFCSECGARLNRKGWRFLVHGELCATCTGRLGSSWRVPVTLVGLIALTAFSLGRYLRPPAAPLIIQRLANSPLSDLPVSQDGSVSADSRSDRSSSREMTRAVTANDDTVYICGARTKKGTPCRRRVHAAGERCFQHKGLPAILPLEKLAIRSK